MIIKYSLRRTSDSSIALGDKYDSSEVASLMQKYNSTTAAIGAIQESLGSETPALGYTVTYAVGNTLLIIWGVFITLMVS